MSKADKISSELSSAADSLALWRGLMESPGWKMLAKMLDEQSRLRQATICLTPLTSFGKSLEQEFMKGEAAGLGLAMSLPETQLELAKLEVTKLNVELEQEQAYEKAGKPDGGSRVDDDDFFGR